jgi:RIO-like serine/threonine protein kinase
MNVDTAADTAQAPHLDQLRTVQQLPLSGDIGQQRTLRDLAAVAAGIQRNKVLGIIGVGLSGQVFSYRLPCGTLVALKFAPAGSEREAALRKEAAVLLKLQDQWDVTTPQLAAAGYDSTGTAFVLGTRYLQWARYMPSDQRLRPQLERALAAAHAVGIAHNDLRDSNVLVQMDHAGQDRLWLIDWGNAVVNASLEQLNKDQLCMESLLSGRE